jgi:hypothetical protein
MTAGAIFIISSSLSSLAKLPMDFVLLRVFAVYERVEILLLRMIAVIFLLKE